jgi:hypothetical protein
MNIEVNKILKKQLLLQRLGNKKNAGFCPTPLTE